MAFGSLTNWFKKRVEDVRDVFDANTARDQQKRISVGQPRYYQDQQKTIQNPGPGKRPDYGTGFAGVRNAFRDVFDANTAQDRFTRVSLGQPENYFDQQKFLNERSLQAPEKRSTLEQIGYNVAGGLSDIAKAPGALLDAKASFDRTKVGKVLNIANPMNAGQNILNTVAEQVKGQKQGTTNEQLNQFLQKVGRQSQDLVENKVQQSRLGQRETDNKFISGVSRATGNLAAQVGAAIASGGATLPSAAMGAITFSEQQKRAKEAGKSDDEAFNIGAVQGGIEAVLERAGLGKLKTPGAGNLITRTGKRFLTEGTQEGAQQFAQNIITNRTYDPNQSLTEGVKESALYGGIAGGIAGSAFDVKPGQVQEATKRITTNPAIAELDSQYKRLNEQWNKAKPNSVERKQLQNAIAENRREKNRISQGGYIRIRSGADGTLDNTSPDNINEPANIVERSGLSQDNSSIAPQVGKPKGFILKETKPRGGRKDTVRISTDKKGKLVATNQTEDVETVDPIADALGITREMVDSLNKNQEGTLQALDRVKNSGSNMLKDMQDQQDYGVKDIQEAPTNSIDDVINKYLEVDEYTPEQMTQSTPKNSVVGKLTDARESVRKTNVLRLANDKVAQGFEKKSRGNKVSRKFVRALQYINKNAGQDPEMIKAAQKYAGENTFADASLLEVGSKAYSLLPTEQSRARVHAVLDPESADGAIKFDDLTPQEQQASQILRDLGDAINDTSYRNKFISKKKWESNRGGRYIARLYNEVATAEDVADLLELPDKRGLHLGMYKSRTELNDDLRQRLIRDPIKLAVIRARQVRQNEALLQYMTTAESRGYVSSSPKDGFVKVSPENRMANWAGKYVRQDVYENIEGFRAMGKGINALNNLLDVYDGNPLRRMRKKMLTIYNPVVRTGNITSNYFFAYLNGVNPLTFQKNKSWANGVFGIGKKGGAINRKDPLFVAAQKSGLIGNDIVRTDKNIFNKDKQFLTDLERNSQGTLAKIKGAPSKFDDWASRRYGNADDIAKLAALKSHVDRGIPVDRAIEMTRRGFQDYTRVGHAYDMGAKLPLFGNAFIRFQGDLYTNILKNAAIDHPMRLGALIIGTAALGNALSNLSGESEEDKKTREDRAGAPKIPFTNISTEFQTPFGALDIARFTPLYMRQDIDGNSLADNISRLSPFNIPSNLSKEELVKKAASDPLIGPGISLLGDTDWRGKSITDPDGIRNGEDVFPDDPLTSGEKRKNQLQYGLRSYLPYPANEVGDILAALNQNKRNEQTAPGTKGDPSKPGAKPLEREGFNTSGSKKTTGQALARLFGVRAEKFGPGEAQEKRELDKLFDFFDKQDEFKDTLDSETKKAFENRHKSTRTRSGIQEEFENDPWWKYKSAAELLENPKLFDAEEKYAKLQNEFDGKPIDPIFDLEKGKRDIVLAKKMKLPGSKDEGFNKLYEQEWYQDFRQKQDVYYKEKSAYNKSRGFKDQESDNPYPEASKELQNAMDTYFALPKGTGERSAFIRNNPETWAAITAQWDKQNAWTDKEREKLGLPKIDREEFNGFATGGKRSGRRGGGKKGKGVKLPGFSTANAPNQLKVRVADPKAPATKLRVVQPIKRKKSTIKIAKQAKKIKKT